MPALKVILQEIALLGDDYILNNSGYQWRAIQLLRWLQQRFPADLEIQAQFVRQGRAGEGAIYELDKDGELVSSMPLYWVDRGPLQARPVNIPSAQRGARRATRPTDEAKHP